MKRNRLIAYAVILLILIIIACNPGEQTQNGEGEQVETVTIPEPRPDTFPGNTNLEFHQISWQYFQWLTEEVEGGMLRFEAMNPPESINPGFEKSEDVVLTQAVKSNKANILGGIEQATSDGILVDQNGNAVYTNILINDTYRDFIIKNKLYDPAGLRAVENTLDFPVGSISLKAAWKIVEEGEDSSTFYTRKAKLQKMANKDGKIVLTKETIEANVALVALHIAFVVKDHPEFVWATFEHDKNAPSLKDPSNHSPDAPISDKNWTFYKAGTPAKDGNLNEEPIVKLDEATQKLTPITQAFTQFYLGAGDPKNLVNIKNTNKDNHEGMPPNSVWRNYQEVGAVWFNQPNMLKPNQEFNSNDTLLTGSTKLSNAVIETFTQVSPGLNQCFGCHDTRGLFTVSENMEPIPGKNVLTSHVLIKNYFEQSSK